MRKTILAAAAFAMIATGCSARFHAGGERGVDTGAAIGPARHSSPPVIVAPAPVIPPPADVSAR